jgi:tRNA(Arg) A34 adenosine deaminase TadA
MTVDEQSLREAITLARDNAGRGGRPFGAVVVRDGDEGLYA